MRLRNARSKMSYLTDKRLTAMTCSLALALVATAAHAQKSNPDEQRKTPASDVKEGIVTLADSKIQYFSRGKGETIVLLPGGTLRVVTPNTELAYRAWLRNDSDFFYWTRFHDETSYWKQTNLRIPLSKASLSQVFLEDFASTASEITVVGAGKRIGDKELKEIFSSRPMEEALDYCTSRCPAELQSSFPYHHMNWFTGKKLMAMLKEAGFRNVLLSAFLQSELPVFRNEHFFDKTLPKTSLYAEAGS